MNRNELPVSDEELVDYINQGYQIRALKLNFVEIGSFYGFIVDAKNKKYFLKIYPHDQTLTPIQPTTESLNQTGMALNRFRNEFGMKNLSYMIPDIHGQYCFKINGLTLTLFEYIEGTHPSYSPNQLLADKMAAVFFKLHQIPIQEFMFFEREGFDIHYALGLKGWIQNEFEVIDKINAHEMLAFLEHHKKQLLAGLLQLEEWKERFNQETFTLAITHGDPHHYNVLQSPLDVWLVDWDGIKIAPIERDLWHYKEAPLLRCYLKMNPKRRINHELCEFYQLQRFFEDSRYYLDQVLLKKNSTRLQSEEDKNAFLTHWGWSCCLSNKGC